MRKEKRFFVGALMLLLGLSSLLAQPDSGVYRLKANRGTGQVMTEDYDTRQVVCRPEGSGTAYANQLWELTVSGTDACTLRNVYTGRYVQRQDAGSQVFTTGDATNTLTLTAKGDNWMLSSGSYLHCDALYNVVNWWDPNSTESQWTLEPVEMTEAQITSARTDYQNYLDMQADKADYTEKLAKFFADAACTELNAAYASATDAALREAMAADGLPEALQSMAVKVKNGGWATREKEFRIHEYEPYSDADDWAGPLKVYPYSYMNNPTGVYADIGDMLYVFVGGDVPEDATLYLAGQTGFNPITSRSAGTPLQKGFNVVRNSRDKNMLFVLYTVNTTDKAKKVADFPKLNIHIEGGTVTGYWDKARHNDDDYAAMLAATTHPNFVIKGERHILHVTTANMRSVMPNKITDGINWWDELTRYEQELMGLCKDVFDGNRAGEPDNLTGGEDIYPTYFNNHLWARCGEGLEGLYATNYMTNYYGGAENLVLNYYPENNDFDAWAPAHEVGHVNQNAINMVGTTEASNNLFSNLVLYRTGKHMSRGGTVSTVASDFQAGVPWVSRNIYEKQRMFWQLYLYYHRARNNTAFYPTLFKLLREDPIQRTTPTDAAKESLHFAKKCCEAAGEDLTEFFTVWGFFEPVDNVLCDDYGNFYVTATQEAIDAAKAEMATYEIKNTGLIFIEDRIETLMRTDGIAGERLTYDVPVGQAGDVGQFTQFVNGGADDAAASYVYSVVGNTVTMQGAGGVGFKVYDADGNLVAVSNNYVFDIPVEVAAAGGFTVVALEADEGEGTVQTLAEGGTEAQKQEALEQALALADAYLNLADNTDTRVGYYKASKLLNLDELAERGRQALADGATDDYVRLAEELSAELLVLKQSDNLRVPIVAGNRYVLKNYMYGHCSYVNDNNGVVNNAQGEPTDAYKWEFVPTDTPDLYYLKNVGKGTYVGGVSMSAPVSASASTPEEATKYYVMPVGDGTLYVQAEARGDYQVLHEDAAHNTVGWTTGADASHWYITRVEQTELGAAYEQLGELITTAEALQNSIVERWAPQFPLQCADSEEPFYLSTNANQQLTGIGDHKEGSLDALLDGDEATYFHSSWENGPDEDHYLQVDLGSGQSRDYFTFSYVTRTQVGNSNPKYPKRIVVAGSNDGTNFTTLATLSTSDATNPLPAGSALSYASDAISDGTPYRYLRLTVTDGVGQANGHYFFDMAEFQLFSNQVETVVFKEGAEVDEEVAAASISALVMAKGIYGNTAATAEELQAAYTTLLEAYDALLRASNSESLEELNRLIAETQALKDKAIQSLTTTANAVKLQTGDSAASYYLSTNADQNSTGTIQDGDGLPALLDGDADTYFHSSWQNGPAEDHYLQVDMGAGNGVRSFNFSYTTRNRDNYFRAPASMIVSGSNDGVNFTPFADLINTGTHALPTTGGTPYTSETLGNGCSYRYLRFTVTGGDEPINGHYYFAMAEFALSSVVPVVAYNAGYEYISDDVALFAVSQLERAQAVVAGKGTTPEELKSTYNNLSAAYDALATAVPVYTATLSQVGYATLYLDKAVKIPDGLKAYYCTLGDERANLHEIEQVIPARTGVILSSETPGAYDLFATSDAPLTDVSANRLIGYTEDTQLTEQNGTRYYALSYKGTADAPTNVGFYWPETYNEGTFTAKANKAYLEVPASQAEVKFFSLFLSTPTGLTEAETAVSSETAIYDLAGRRVTGRPTRGLYIVNGKKMLIK